MNLSPSMVNLCLLALLVVSTTAAGCPGGQYDLALKSEGSCTTLITSTTECEAAASTLGLRDNTVKTFSSATRPPGCY